MSSSELKWVVFLNEIQLLYIQSASSVQQEAFPRVHLRRNTPKDTARRLHATLCFLLHLWSYRCDSWTGERSNSTTEPDDACRVIDRVSRRLTPGHSTHRNFIHRMRDYCTAKSISKRPVWLWGHPTTHLPSRRVSLSGKKEKGSEADTSMQCWGCEVKSYSFTSYTPVIGPSKNPRLSARLCINRTAILVIIISSALLRSNYSSI
jgi:hypothetical protein